MSRAFARVEFDPAKLNPRQSEVDPPWFIAPHLPAGRKPQKLNSVEGNNTVGQTTDHLSSHYVIYHFRPEDPGEGPWGMFGPGDEITGIDYSDEPMEDVIAQLAGFFGIEIKMPSELAQRRITASFGKKSCFEMVRSLVDEKDFDIQSTTQTISIIRRGVPGSSLLYVQREPYCD